METSLSVEVVFWLLAAAIVGSALAVVLLRNLFHAALLLVLCFFGVAGIYVLLHADFLAAAQVLIYVGAIAVLLIFAIMLTRQVQRGSPFNRLWFPAGIAAAGLLATLIYVFRNTNWHTWETNIDPLTNEELGNGTTGPLADSLFNSFVLPFEVASVLLLAAIIGAIVIIRNKK
ncbi:NADH-quinone oxidoreductase subunit J [Chloroflexota bacterium]